jgi:hypothetical protein
VKLADLLRVATSELARQQAAFALVGGLAVSARTEPRFTRDIDLAVAVADDEEAERRVRTLADAGFVIDSAVEQTATRRLATVRLRPPGGGGNLVDLLFASSGIEPDMIQRSEPIEVLPGVTVPVAQIGDLIALKLLARDDVDRPQDRVDLVALAAAAVDSDWEVAGLACDAIVRRGFNRERALTDALAELRGPKRP